jgi:hypothetical protein
MGLVPSITAAPATNAKSNRFIMILPAEKRSVSVPHTAPMPVDVAVPIAGSMPECESQTPALKSAIHAVVAIRRKIAEEPERAKSNRSGRRNAFATRA